MRACSDQSTHGCSKVSPEAHRSRVAYLLRAARHRQLMCARRGDQLQAWSTGDPAFWRDLPADAVAILETDLQVDFSFIEGP